MGIHPGRAILDALEALLLRDNDDAFVIIEDWPTGKFVQFGRGPSLVLDLPLASLEPDEIERAQTFFEARGYGEARHLIAFDSAAQIPRPHSTFELDFGTNALEAAKTAVDVFDQVFLLQRVSLALTEN
ncbi:MAG: hypothetical protein AAGN64_05150 [Bacteroidota bacterium]